MYSEKPTDHILMVERELSRIAKVSRVEYPNPLLVLGLGDFFRDGKNACDTAAQEVQIKTQYRRLVRLIHPDKSYDTARFGDAFNVVNNAYKALHDKEKRKICIRALSADENLDIIYAIEKEEDVRTKETKAAAPPCSVGETRMVVWNQRSLVVKEFNNTQNEKEKVIVNIAIDGAEHTKNKCKSKSDKHQKGLKQRVVQRKNAENRVINHDFSFSDKVVKEKGKKKG